MGDWLGYGGILVAGFAIGLFFYGGLWWTVHRLTRTTHPAVLFILSFVGRTLVSVTALYVVTGAQIEKILLAVIGFFLARIVLVRQQTAAVTTHQGEAKG